MIEVQRLASSVVSRVLSGRSLNSELARLWRRHPGLSAHQRAVTQDICFGSLRFLGRIDALLDGLLEKPLRDDRLRALLRTALYQLEYSNAAPHAVVDHAVRACEQLHLAAAKGLANAVLRNFLRRRGELVVQAQRGEYGRYSHPQWWIDKLRAQYPSQYAAILEASNLHPPMTLRVNRRRSTVERYLSRLGAGGIAADLIDGHAVRLAAPMPVGRIPGFSEGEVSVQDAAAQRAAPLLAAGKGMRVLDACAAPGGKTTHILELADVELIALDIDTERLDRLRDNLARLKLTARILHGDACAPDAWWDGKQFERILADVPCSASGVTRRHPDVKWLRRASDIAAFVELQQSMLEALWRLLVSGGKLLYATCSVFHEENQLQIARFLERHRDAQLLTQPGADIHIQQAPGQLLPDEQHDGFFYALLAKS